MAKKRGKLEERRDWLGLQGSAALALVACQPAHTAALLVSGSQKSDFYLEILVIDV